MNYSPITPRDKDNFAKVGYPPAKVALESNNNENISVSSVLAFTHDTTEIEVTAVGQGVAGRWATNQATSVVTATGAGADFDFVVPVSESRRFVVPIATYDQNSGSVMGVNRKQGLFQNIAYKTLAGNGSVLTSEY
jgi:hypothetical protein